MDCLLEPNGKSVVSELTASEIEQLAAPGNVMLPGGKLFWPRKLKDTEIAILADAGPKRCDGFVINYEHPLAEGLVFGGTLDKPGMVFIGDPSAKG